MRRRRADRSLLLVQKPRSGTFAASSRARFRSVRLGKLTLRLPHAVESAIIKQWRSPSWNRPCIQLPLPEMRLRASIRSSRSPNGKWCGLSNGTWDLPPKDLILISDRSERNKITNWRQRATMARGSLDRSQRHNLAAYLKGDRLLLNGLLGEVVACPLAPAPCTEMGHLRDLGSDVLSLLRAGNLGRSRQRLGTLTRNNISHVGGGVPG